MLSYNKKLDAKSARLARASPTRALTRPAQSRWRLGKPSCCPRSSCQTCARGAAAPVPCPAALTRRPLRQRDREILKGIAPTGARTYPMRAGEKLGDVLKGRGVTMAEAQALHPGVDLTKVKDGQLVKLPYGRYTQREKEMLSSVVPATSLGLPSTVSFSQAQLQFGLLAALAVAAYAFYVKQAAAWTDRE